MLAMGVAERRPLPIGLGNEAPSILIDGQILTESEVRLEIPVGVLVDFTSFATVQCEHWERNIPDTISDCLGLL